MLKTKVQNVRRKLELKKSTIEKGKKDMVVFQDSNAGM